MSLLALEISLRLGILGDDEKGRQQPRLRQIVWAYQHLQHIFRVYDFLRRTAIQGTRLSVTCLVVVSIKESYVEKQAAA